MGRGAAKPDRYDKAVCDTELRRRDETLILTSTRAAARTCAPGPNLQAADTNHPDVVDSDVSHTPTVTFTPDRRVRDIANLEDA